MAEPALTLRDHPQIIDLISSWNRAGFKSRRKKYRPSVGYIDGMEEKLSQMMDEMKEMRLEVGKPTTRESAHGAPSFVTLWRVSPARPK